MDKALTARIGADLSDLKAKMGEAKGIIGGFTDNIAALGPMIVGAFSVGSIVAFGKAAVTAAGEAVDGENRLLVALHGREDIQKRLLSQANDIAGRSLFEDDAIIQQQAMLAALGRNETQIKKVIEAAIQLSVATGTDLGTSVLALNKTYEGLDRGLKAIDPSMRGMTATALKNGEAIDLVAKKYQNFAESAAKVGSGPIQMAEKQMGEFSEMIGRVFLPGVGKVANAFTQLLNLAMDDNLTMWQKLTLDYKLNRPFAEQTEEILAHARALNEDTDAQNAAKEAALKENPGFLASGLRAGNPKVKAGGAGKAKGAARSSALASFDGGDIDVSTKDLDYLTANKDFYDRMKAIDQDYTDSLKEQNQQRTAAWMMYSMTALASIDGIVSGNMSVAQGIANATKSIVNSYEAQAIAAAISKAIQSGGPFPWLAVAQAIAVSAAVSALFSAIGGSSHTSGGGSSGGSAMRDNSSLANGNMQTVQIQGVTQISGTQLQIVWQRQMDQNTYTQGPYVQIPLNG